MRFIKNGKVLDSIITYNNRSDENASIKFVPNGEMYTMHVNIPSMNINNVIVASDVSPNLPVGYEYIQNNTTTKVSIKDFQPLSTINAGLSLAMMTANANEGVGGRPSKSKIKWISTGRKVSVKEKGKDGKFHIVKRTVYQSDAKPGQQRIAYKAADGSREFKTFKQVP